MPGILPMKVIKVGNNPQSRIAQACDRCRSKKIRCDGIRPCCSQCSAVGFECKTSDKLSRRAFPRGYTESLEERVRSLESEVRDLKGLLDEKDEKIELLSRIHSFASPSQKSRSPAYTSPSTAVPGPITPPESSKATTSESEGTIHVQACSSPPTKSSSTTPFTGPSSVRAFSTILTTKVVERGTPLPSIQTKALTAITPKTFQSSNQTPTMPPRMVSDQLISIYFQEWAPLYPVVHRPAILKAYDTYVTKPKSLQGTPHLVAQLNLIFGIAAISSKSRTNQNPAIFEKIWYPMVELLSGDSSISAMQCLVLAQMYNLVKGDYQSLSRYRGLAISMAQVLGLYQSQKQLALDPLSTETRKKVFWCQFILDRFTAAATGLPVMLRENDIDIELPADVDDENVTETGFVPAVPGESTRLSTALALLEASKILGKVLEVLYPSTAAFEISMSKLRGLSEELDTWHKNLPSHLKLIFSQDKPSTNVTGSRSPLISLVYYYIRALIHRPAACFGNPRLASASILATSDSSKHIVQILELLDERCLSLSLAVNRLEIVYSAGLGLLWQSLSLKRDSKLAKETHKTLLATRKQLEPESKAAASEFRALTNTITGTNVDRQTSTSSKAQALSPKKALQSLQSRLFPPCNTEDVKGQEVSRRNTTAGTGPSPESRRAEIDRHQMHNASHPPSFQQPFGKRRTVDLSADINMDFYPVDVDGVTGMASADPSNMPLSTTDWELIVGDLDRGHSNIFNGIYGGRECGTGPSHFDAVLSGYPIYATSYATAESARPASQELSPNTWSPGSGELSHAYDGSSQSVHSVHSRSEDDLGSTEDLLATEGLGMQHVGGINMGNSFRGIVVPSVDDEFIDLGFLDGWEQQLAAT